MPDIDDLMRFTKLSGFRLIVLANRPLCDNAFQYDLHERLATLLADLAQSTRQAMASKRALFALPPQPELIGPPDLEDYHDHLRDTDCDDADAGEEYELLDDLEIDYGTYEYRINDGRWCCAYSADCDGASLDYPRSASVNRGEIGSLADILTAIRLETGILITVTKVTYD